MWNHLKLTTSHFLPSTVRDIPIISMKNTYISHTANAPRSTFCNLPIYTPSLSGERSASSAGIPHIGEVHTYINEPGSEISLQAIAVLPYGELGFQPRLTFHQLTN